jgi:large subunit ribosomal protein L9
MRVILREDVDKLGAAGEIVNVRDGFHRNYLLPRGLAVVASEGDVARIAHEQRAIAARNAKVTKDLQVAADALSKASVSIARASGEGDKLYGSVTNRDIAESLAAQGFTVDPRRIDLAEPIKALGLTEVTIKLGKSVTATVKVWVVKQEA